MGKKQRKKKNPPDNKKKPPIIYYVALGKSIPAMPRFYSLIVFKRNLLNAKPLTAPFL